MCVENFVQNTTRLEDVRFCVRILLKQSYDNLDDSVHRAKHCLLSSGLKGQSLFKKRYCDFMT